MKKMTNKKTPIAASVLKESKAGPSKMPAGVKKKSGGKNMGLVEGMRANMKKNKVKTDLY